MVRKTMHAVPVAAVLALASLACAAADVKTSVSDKAAAAVAGVKERAKLATLCEACAVVEGTRRETRKGDASGVGAVGGAVAGGVVGNKTTDSTLGTVGGAAIGGVLGHQIEKRIKREKVWITTVTMKDGSKREFVADKDPQWAAGSVVEVVDGKLRKRG